MTQSPSKLTRRRVFAGAGALGAVAAAAVVVPAVREASTPTATESPPDKPKGYRVTAHVTNYYRTAKV
jgi:hypothetical protein